MPDLDHLTDAGLDDRERRIRADVDDARKTLNAARARYESLTDELRDIRLIRAARQNTNR